MCFMQLSEIYTHGRQTFLLFYLVIHVFLYSALSTCYVQICLISCLCCNHFCHSDDAFSFVCWCVCRLTTLLMVQSHYWFQTNRFGILNQFLHISTPRAFFSKDYIESWINVRHILGSRHLTRTYNFESCLCSVSFSSFFQKCEIHIV